MTKQRGGEDQLGKLIDALTPLKNQFAVAEAKRKVEILWEVGDYLERAGITSSHGTGWKVQERSYITRDMLTKGYQVRMRWPTRQALDQDLPTLCDYSTFRNLFPYVVGTLRPSAELEARLLGALRRDSPKEANALLRELRKGRAAPRKRAVSDEEDGAIRAIAEYLQEADEFAFRADPEAVCGSRRLMTDGQLDWFSRACLAIAGAIRQSEIGRLDETSLPPSWLSFSRTVPFVLADARGSRFRSRIDRKRFASAASNLQWCKSKSGLDDLRASRKA